MALEVRSRQSIRTGVIWLVMEILGRYGWQSSESVGVCVKT